MTTNALRPTERLTRSSARPTYNSNEMPYSWNSQLTGSQTKRQRAARICESAEVTWLISPNSFHSLPYFRLTTHSEQVNNDDRRSNDFIGAVRLANTTVHPSRQVIDQKNVVFALSSVHDEQWRRSATTMRTVPARSARIRLSRKELRSRRIERQHRWLLFWLIAGLILLCVWLYPVAIFVAHYYDDAEKKPLTLEHTAK